MWISEFITPFVRSLDSGWMQMMSFTSRAFYAYRKAISILCVGTSMPSRAGHDHLEKGKTFAPPKNRTMIYWSCCLWRSHYIDFVLNVSYKHTSGS